MQQRTVEQVNTWESRPFSGGFSALHDLSEESFSGAVVADETWLFMLNGRVVGVFQGDIDDFEGDFGGDEATVYVAPHDSLPLLFSMQERGGETRAKYFTNDTPLAEADKTLRDANFTGYIELSENVLSGDYYVIYYGGKKMSAAFIGQSERFVSGDEAYDRAADEVGIYEVKDVSMNITEIPAPPRPESEPEPEPEPESEPGASTATGAATSQTDSAIDEAEPAAEPEATESPSEASVEQPGEERSGQPETGTEPAGRDTHEPAEAEGADQPASEPGPEETTAEAHSDEPSPKADADETPGRASSGGPGSDTGGDRSPDDAEPRSTKPEPEPDPDSEPDAPDRSTPGSTTGDPRAGGTASNPESTETDTEEQRPVFKEEEEWRQTRSIPALDPDETAGEREDTQTRQPRKHRRPTQPTEESAPSQSTSTPDPETTEKLEQLQRAVDERESKIEELSESLDTERSERENVERQLTELRDERDDLEERISNLESALQRAKDQQVTVSPDAVELDPEEAISGTNLFVRYDSKGKPTLSALEGGEVDPDAVNENLRLEHHTQFESENAVVTGESFDEFLEETNYYRFVSWLVRTLPYELLESGKQSALGELYDAIPDIDRVEFDGSVTVETEDGTATNDFDVVIRDRMGNPLIVANLNAERDPVRGEEMSDLLDSATVVSGSEASLAGAFYVTASFFEPDALEVAESAASSGGLFRRSDKASYVKTAGKSGFHLCLIEDRAEAFHVTVPEL